MSKAGFKGNMVYAKYSKAGDRYIIDKQNIPIKNFDIDTVDMLSGIGTGLLYIASGVWTIGWNQSMVGKASTMVTVPGGIPRNTKANVILSWCAISGVAVGDAIFDVDYRSVATKFSGVTVVGEYYTTSGVSANATVTHTLISGGSVAATTTLQQSKIEIPDTAIKENNLLILNIYRDTGEAGDTMTADARLFAVDLEYVRA